MSKLFIGGVFLLALFSLVMSLPAAQAEKLPVGATANVQYGDGRGVVMQGYGGGYYYGMMGSGTQRVPYGMMGYGNYGSGIMHFFVALYGLAGFVLLVLGSMACVKYLRNKK